MFVPVNCTSCGKPFQVPEAALGKPTLCPWCQAVVAALPVGAAVEAPAPAPAEPAAPPAPADVPKPKWLTKYTTERPRARPLPVATPAGPQPLSLDDEPEPPVPAPKAAPLFSPGTVAAVVGVSLAALALTVFVRGYGSGRVQEALWSEWTAPDGSCAVLLPAPPTEEDVPPNPDGSVTGGKRFAAVGWYTRSAAWVAWNDLTPEFAKAAQADKDRAFTASALKAELEREKARLRGTVTREAVVQSGSGWGYEVHMTTPGGTVIEWLLIAPGGPRPRVYVYGLRASNIAHDSAVVRRMFTSFKVLE